jgi:hypothetical protein
MICVMCKTNRMPKTRHIRAACKTPPSNVRNTWLDSTCCLFTRFCACRMTPSFSPTKCSSWRWERRPCRVMVLTSGCIYMMMNTQRDKRLSTEAFSLVFGRVFPRLFSSRLACIMCEWCHTNTGRKIVDNSAYARGHLFYVYVRIHRLFANPACE